MEVDKKSIKELRDRTQAGFLECKKALIENNNNIEKSIDYLRERGIAKASKKAGRATSEGLIMSYIHGNGKIGVMIEINSETDFVAKNEKFNLLAKDICMQIAAMSPVYVQSSDIPEEVLEKEKNIIRKQLEQEGKKDIQIEKIIPGKIKKYFSDICLLDQIFIKDSKKTIEQLIQEAISKFGENIVVSRFTRFEIGGT